MAPSTYRDPSAAPPVHVVVHRPMKLPARIVVFVIGLVMLATFVAGAVQSLSDVELSCREEVCRLDDRNAILPNETVVVRAEDITAVRVDERKQKRSTRYVVVLVTPRDEIELDARSSRASDMYALAATIEAFRADPKREVVSYPLHVRSFPGAIFILGLSVIPLLFMWFVTLHTRVEVDVARGVMRVIRRGHPFPRDVRQLALHEVRHASIEQDGDFNRVVIVLTSGEHVPLQSAKTKDDRSLQTAEAINQALQVS